MTIRARLLGWLLPAFLVLWLSAGLAMYWVVKQLRVQELDSELRSIVGTVRLLSSAPRGRMRREPLRADAFRHATNGTFYQVWNSAGETVSRSESLEGENLPRPASFSRTAAFTNFTLPNGISLRGIAVRNRARGPTSDLNYLVAKDRSELDGELSRLRIGIYLGCAIGPLCFATLLVLALRSGLRPLVRLGEQAAQIDAASLEQRFPTDPLPGEMAPIVARLNELMARLEQSFERERRFSGDLAHELRTPLAAIRSTSEVAAKWPEQTTGQEHDEIAATAARMQRTVDCLLQLARTEKSAAEAIRESVRLGELIDRCLATLKRTTSERKIEIRNDMPRDATMNSHPDLLATIVTNLLTNAIDYSPPGSEVRISSGDSASCLTISNPAPDLSPEDLPRLFDRLWRGDLARAAAEHSGLGLSLARNCAEILGLKLEARLDDGQVVHFCLLKEASE